MWKAYDKIKFSYTRVDYIGCIYGRDVSEWFGHMLEVADSTYRILATVSDAMKDTFIN
jgi:hypothetical protein